MAQYTQDNIVITDAGLTKSYSKGQLPDIIYIAIDNAGATLAADVDISSNFAPNSGTTVEVFINGSTTLDLNGHTFSLFGSQISADQLKAQVYFAITSIGVDWSAPFISCTLDNATLGGTINGKFITNNSLPLEALESGTSAQIPVCNSRGVLDLVTMTGDTTISNLGAVTIKNDAITNAKVSASAAIARSKLAAGTASQVVVNDGSGVLTSEATLSPLRGGLGTDASSATGLVTFSSGTASIGARTESQTFMVSFDTASELGDVKVLMPYDCTVTGYYAAVTKTVEATNNATITPKNNAGTTMTGGALTLTAGTTIGTAFTSTPSDNNTFTAGQVMTLKVAKGTAGGKVLLTMTYTRTN